MREIKIINGMKQCSKCKKALPVSFFNKDSTHKSRLQSRCKECGKPTIPYYSKKGFKIKIIGNKKPCSLCGRLLSIDKFTKHSAARTGLQSRCKDCMRPIIKNYELERKYNITLSDYDQMFELQNGNCKICGLPEINKRLAVDHCHKTGNIRDLLCSRCNTVLGHVEENQETLWNMIDYLKKYEVKNGQTKTTT